MEYYKMKFLEYLRIKELEEKRKINMKKSLVEIIKLGQNEIEYYLRINSSGRGKKKILDLMAISTLKPNNKQPCFIMKIIPGGESVLICFNKELTSFLANLDDSTRIVPHALEIAHLKGAKTFEFTDNSTKSIEGKIINLTDLSFLTTGKTWYERIFPTIKIADENDRINFEQLRIKIKNNAWADVYNNFISNFNIEADFDTNGINIEEAGSAMIVLNRAIKNKKNTDLFYLHTNKLLLSNYLCSLHGLIWIIDVV
jgi:hypothetical protein